MKGGEGVIGADCVYCGVFDSSVIRENAQASLDRTVECYEIELFHGDGGVSFVDGVAYPCRRGMLLCAKPYQIRHSKFPVRCSFIRYFPRSSEDGIARILSELPTVRYVEEEGRTEELLALLSRLAECFCGAEMNAALTVRINALFYEALYKIMMPGEVGRKCERLPVGRAVSEAYEFINENYTGDCSLARIAAAVRVSPNYLHTAFTEKLGMTPYEYTRAKRIDRAKRLIIAGEKSMLEIALELGFCSQSHFNKQFKLVCGYTPHEYKRKTDG